MFKFVRQSCESHATPGLVCLFARPHLTRASFIDRFFEFRFVQSQTCYKLLIREHYILSWIFYEKLIAILLDCVFNTLIVF